MTQTRYEVLALKYRPRTFDEVVGQEVLVRTLTNAISTGKVGHAFLFCGPRGVGKTTTARILAKALNCRRSEQPTPTPCREREGACEACLEIMDGSSLDVQEIDGASNNGVEQVRELRESARYRPARDRYKVWIIDEVHMLTTGAFNALLKTLEEPQPHVKFLFATTEFHKIPETILSRCQQFDLRLVGARKLVAHLRAVAGREGITVSDASLSRVARAAEGSVRDALSLFDQVLAFCGSEVNDDDVPALLGMLDRELLLSASGAVAGSDGRTLLLLVERLAEHGADYRHFLRELVLHFRELLLLKLAPDARALEEQLTPEDRARLQPLAEAFSEEDLLRTLDVLLQTDQDMRQASDTRVTLELALLKLAQFRRLVPLAELIARVEKLSAGLPVEEPAPPRPSLPAAAPRSTPRPAAAPSRPAPAGPGRETPRAEVAAASAPASPSAAASAAVAPSAVPSGAAELVALMLRDCRVSLAQPLRSSRPSLEGDVLSLALTPEFATFAEMHLDEYVALARKASGRSTQVRVVATESAAERPPTPAETKKQRLVEEATQEPAVQEALDLFGGRVLGVRES